MAVTEETDIEEAVRYLSDNDAFSFPSVHWQMDANFWHDFLLREYAARVEAEYNPGIRLLVSYWVEAMRTEGRVLRCGCGHANTPS